MPSAEVMDGSDAMLITQRVDRVAFLSPVRPPQIAVLKATWSGRRGHPQEAEPTSTG